MERITVHYAPIAASGGFVHHKYIFYQNSQGSTFQVHGGGTRSYGMSPIDEMAIALVPGTAPFGKLHMRIIEGDTISGQSGRIQAVVATPWRRRLR